MLFSTTLGVAYPDIGIILESLILPFVAVLVFVSLNTIEIDNASSSLDQLKLGSVAMGVFGVLIAWAILPVVGLSIGVLLLSPEALTAVLIILSAPTTAGSALVWSRLSDSSIALTGSITALTIMLSPLITPFILTFSLSDQVAIQPISILIDLVLVVGGGVVLHIVVPDKVRTSTVLDRVSIFVVVLLIYIAISTSGVSGVDIYTISRVSLHSIAVLSISLIVSSAGVRLIGGGRPQSTGVFFGSSMKNLGIAVAITTTIQISGLVVVIVIFYITQQLFAGVIIGWVEIRQTEQG